MGIVVYRWAPGFKRWESLSTDEHLASNDGNRCLPVGTWLQTMGIQPPCKGCEQGLPESTQHCLMDCLLAQLAWKAFLQVWEEWEAPNRLVITWPFVLLGEAVFEEDDDPSDLHCYHTRGFSYRRQPLGILRSFLLFYLWSERHFDDQYSLKRVLLQAWEVTAEVGMASSKAIRSSSQSRDQNIQSCIEKAFKAEWLHGHIFGEGESAISWHLLPPCISSISLMTEGAVASLPARGSPPDIT